VASELLTRQAVALMHERAKGIPRTISVIADNALLGGFAAGLKPVGVDLVAEICRDFDFGTGSAKSLRESEAGAAVPHPEKRGPGADKGLFGAFSNRRKLFSFWS